MTGWLGALLRMLLFVAFGAHAVPAQVAPPTQLQPVLALISPTVSPVCGYGAIAVALLAEEGGTLPLVPTVIQGAAPVVELCGAVPAPKGGYQCALDQTEIGLLNQITGVAIGSPSPVAVAPVATAVQQIAYITAAVSPTALAPLASTIAATVQCAPLPAARAAPSPPTSAASPPVLPAPAPPTFSLPPVTSDGAPPATASTQVTPAPAAPATEALPAAQPAVRTSIPAGSGGFRYSAILLAPLVLLALVLFLANAFTRPIRVRRSRD